MATKNRIALALWIIKTIIIIQAIMSKQNRLDHAPRERVGMKIYGLNKENFAKIIIAFPDLEAQKQISQLMMVVDDAINLLEQELLQWQQKKKSLMQLLLTGLVRVTV